MATKAPLKQAKALLTTLHNDRENALLRIDEYLRGIQDDPYMPEMADAEYRMLADRSKTNVMQFIVSSASQAMYVDDFRRGHKSGDSEASKDQLEAKTRLMQPAWNHWQQSRLDARQAAIYRGALAYGHSFTITEKDKDGQVRTKGLSPLRTAALYEDAANDDAPLVSATVTKFPKGDDLGTARMWDDELEYAITFKSLSDMGSVVVKKVKRHGASENPMTRFVAAVDLDGRTHGVVAPMIPLQDRINQTVFDLLVVQSFASFKVRTISGMAPPLQMHGVDVNGVPTTVAADIVDYEPTLDANGRPIPESVNVSAKRMFWAEDQDTKFGTLDETPLDGFIEAIRMAFQHMAALSQTPPHHLLGQIANLSAEALMAAETALIRKVQEFCSSFGESWERVFRLAAEIGEYDGADDFAGEVIWRDMEQRSLAQAGDALGKLAESLGIPQRGLWARVPGVTSNELAHWEELYEQQKPDIALARAASTTRTRPPFRENNPQGPLDATKDVVIA